MKPAAFDYRKPAEEDETIDLLDRYGLDAKLLAGGQSLIPLMNFRLVRPSLVIDINGVSSLKRIEVVDSVVHIGALARHVELETNVALKKSVPLLSLVAPYIGHPQIRTRGTLGGSLAHADPSAELPAAMVALDAVIVVRGPKGVRRVLAEEFFKFHLTADLEADELVLGVEIPVATQNRGYGFKEIAARFGDFAIVGAIASFGVDANEKVEHARIVCMAVGPKPLRIHAAESALNGRRIDDAVLAEVSSQVARALDPTGDKKASASYKRRTSATLVSRAIKDAWQMTTMGDAND